VPHAVTYLIEDLARSHGRLTVGEAGVYVRADDPALLAGAVADRRMQKLDVEVLAPTVAVVHGATVSSLLKILRQAGYMPVAEKGGASIDRPRGREAPILRRAHGRTRPAPSAQQVRAAAEALSAGRVPAASRDDRRPISGRGPIVQALRRAQRGAGRIEIGYRGPTGVAVHRVEAFVVGRKQVSAWDVEDNRPRSFLIDRIQWVRAVNEADVEDLYGTG
jgi:Helicase conserved C-terminal domain